jgi:2TM domain
MPIRADPSSESLEIDSEREAARKQVQARRDFGSHLVAYVVINAFLVAVWAITGAGYFWPAWVIAGWGIGLVLHAWDVFWRKPVTEADIDNELRRHRR